MPAVRPPARPVLVATVATGALLALTLAGCTSHSRNNVPTPSLRSPAPQTSVRLTSPAPASSSAMPEAVLPHGCGQLLPVAVIQQALGAPLPGDISYLRAAAVPQSGRTGRVTCDYGTPLSTSSAGAPATPTPTGRGLVEASYITYVDAKTAASRVQLTVQTDGRTSTITKVTVGGKQGYVLLGKEWNELVMADGARTIVVEASPTVLPATRAPQALAVMASAMLRFDASPSSSPSASPSPASS